MNSMNDERFFELAMKAIARQCTDAERAELDALLVGQPELRVEFERLQREVRVAKEALPLVNATEATTGEFPAYARGRLQTKVRQTLGRPVEDGDHKRERELSLLWRWRWVLGLAAATAAVALILVPVFRQPPQMTIQVAMLDVGGPSRGGETNETALLGQTWQKTKVESFADAEALRMWETNWPTGKGLKLAKVIYDRAAAEVRVAGKTQKGAFAETFLVETDLPSALSKASAFIKEQFGE